MRLAVMQPYFFPYSGYFQLINEVDKFVIFDDVNYISRGWINRNCIRVGGKPKLFTMPLKKASRNRLINEIEIADEFPGWKTGFLRTLRTNYGKSQCFKEVFTLVQQILDSDEKNLSNFLVNSLQKICRYLDIRTTIVPSSARYENSRLRAQERIIDICRQENVTEYVNLPGGRKLYSTADFKNAGFGLCFIEPQLLEYTQRADDVARRLSIVDTLMFNTPMQFNQLITDNGSA